MYATLAYPKGDGPLVDPRPSSSILLFNSKNELLLLHRVKTSSAFPSAHVFPGGTLSEYHETVPALGSPERHFDGPAYRLAAVRETFEESGILLARKKGQKDGPLIHLSPEAIDEGRKAIHGDKIRFTDWLDQIGGEPDVDNLIPFTRWITPPHLGKRFSAQMYLYFLPLDDDTTPPPSHDGGIEHTEALFDIVPAWIQKASRGDVVMYEPQAYLINVVGQFLDGKSDDYQAQRDALRQFATSPPTGPNGAPSRGPASHIAWSEKVMCPYVARADSTGRAVLSIESPGPDLAESGRGGDYDRVVIVRSWDSMPREVEVKWRKDVLKVEGQETPKL